MARIKGVDIPNDKHIVISLKRGAHEQKCNNYVFNFHFSVAIRE